GVPAPELPGPEGVAVEALGQIVGAAGEGVFDPGDPAVVGRPRPAERRAVAGLEPAETGLRDVFLADQERVARPVGDALDRRVRLPGVEVLGGLAGGAGD